MSRGTQTSLKVPYPQNVTQFIGTPVNVISFYPVRKIGLPCAGFHENHKFLVAVYADLLHRITTKIRQKCRESGQKLIYASDENESFQNGDLHEIYCR
jgi:hypothetical protein